MNNEINNISTIELQARCQNTLLQPIRPETKVIRLTEAEVTKYFATKQEYLQSLRLGNYT